MKKERIFKIYSLNDPITNQVRYIGFTTAKLNMRLSQHIWNSKNKDTYKTNWINGLLEKNLKPIINLIEIVEETNWEEREIYWIDYYVDCNLVNTDKGGRGAYLERKKDSINKSTQFRNKSVYQIDPKTLKIINTFSSQKEVLNYFKTDKKTYLQKVLIAKKLAQFKGYNFQYVNSYNKEKFENKIINFLINSKFASFVIYPNYEYFNSENKEKLYNCLLNTNYGHFKTICKHIELNEDFIKNLIIERKKLKIHFSKAKKLYDIV
jgi:hypothetical protein